MAKANTAAKRGTKTTKGAGAAAKIKTEGKGKPTVDLATADLTGVITDKDILAALDAEAESTAGSLTSDAPVETVDKEAIYEAQDGGTDIVSTSAAETRKRAGRAKRELVASEVKTVFGSSKIIGKIDDLPVKIQSKARNAIAAMTSGVRLSGYTRYAAEALLAAENQTMTGTQLRDILTARGYTPGTASAQAQQQMTLLPFLGVAQRDGKAIKIADTELMDKLLAQPAE